MPVISSFNDPHDVVPLSLISAPEFAPGLSIYIDKPGTFGTGSSDDYFISVNDTGIELTDGATVVPVQYSGQDLDTVRAGITNSNTAFFANALNEALSLNSGDLTFNTGESTSDGGYIVRLKRHIVKYNEETRIRVLPPYQESSDFPWYARVNVGQFSKDYQGGRHVFGIPEYRKQVWSARYGYPYMTVGGEQPEFLDKRRIRVARKPILWRDNNISMRIKNRDAFPGIIDDVDENNGIIYLNTDISDVNGIAVSYVYKQLDYVYKHINLNPAIDQNPAVVGSFVLFYVIPEKSQPGNISRTRTVFHTISNTLLGAIYSIPRLDFPITLLGAMQVRQTNTISDINLYDIRSRGGGIKEDKFEEAVEINRNANAIADLGWIDGVPYPGNSVIICNLPSELKDTMSVEEIKQRALKHAALGTTMILEFE